MMYDKSEAKIEVCTGLNTDQACPQFSLASKQVVFVTANLCDNVGSSTVLRPEISIPETYHLPEAKLIKALRNRLRIRFDPRTPLLLSDGTTIFDVPSLNKTLSINKLLEKTNPDPELIDYTASMPPKRSYKLTLKFSSRKKGKPNSSRSEILIDE